MENVTTAPSNQLTVIEKSLPILSQTKDVLLNHQGRVSKAVLVCQNILQAIEANGGKLNPELDTRIQNFLANCNKAVKELEDSRKPLTQTMDLIRKLFTSEESKIDVSKKDSLVYPLQLHRNAYAKQLLEEEQLRQREAEEKAAKSKEAIDIRTQVKNGITQCFLDFLSQKKESIIKSFNAITLENFEQKSNGLKLMPTAFPLEKLQELIATCTKPSYHKHTAEEAQRIINEEMGAFDFTSFNQQFEAAIKELKQSLIDKLPSKKQELDAMAVANENEKVRLENERLNREAEEKRLRDEEEYRQRMEAEKKLEAEKMAAETQVLFDQTLSLGEVAPSPESRQRYDIVVTHPAGWTEIFALWFQHEGAKCSLDELEKMTFKKMKAFAEDKAFKDDVRITSKYIKYELSVKAVNRKVK